MRFCQPHWNRLRAAIDARGLTPLVSDGGMSAGKKLIGESRDGSSVENFDPLIGAHNRIVGHALNAAGLALLEPNEDGSERCPLCYLKIEHAKQCRDPACGQDFEQWIELAADGAKAHFDELMRGTGEPGA